MFLLSFLRSQLAAFEDAAELFCPRGGGRPAIRLYDTVVVAQPQVLPTTEVWVNPTQHPNYISVHDLTASRVFATATGCGHGAAEVVVRMQVS